MKQLRNFKQQKGVCPEAVAANPAFNEAMEKYGGMSEDALIEQLVSQVASAKQNGTYNAGQMQAYIQMLSPHLSEQQRNKLDNVLRVIEAE